MISAALGNPPPFAVEQVNASASRLSATAFADPDLRHAQAFGDRDECPLGAGVEIEQRILAERFDQPYRQADVALGAA